MKKSNEYEFPDATGRPIPEQVDPATAAAVVLVPKDEAEAALAFPTRARAIKIHDQTTLDEANDLVRRGKAGLKFFDGIFDPHIDRAYEQHRGLLAEKRRFTAPFKQGLDIAGPRIADYLYEEDQKRLAESRARQLALEKAEREIEKTVDKAQSQIQKGQAAKASETLDKGYAMVEELRQAIPEVAPAVRAEGTSLRTTWDFEITDEAALPREYLMPNLVAIRKVVTGLKDQARIPGVRAYPVRSISTKLDK